jgi:BirA family biotin operon repressor/biotin-[acetyl-CoA-carboxylase] ligase
MLDLAAITHALGARARRFDVDLREACPSTNAELLVRAEAGAASGTVIVTRNQTQGRGRQGRAWIATPGDSLTFSLLWRFAPGTAPAGLSLAVGLAVAQAVDKVGAGGTAPLQLKWPNDLLKDRKKLGGILIELVPGAPHAAIIGIGLNLRLPAGMPPELTAQSAALDSPVDASVLLAAILVELLDVLTTFAHGGFAPLRDAWTARHAFENRPIRLLADFAPPRTGLCRGVASDGALLLETAGRIERVLSGEVSLRPAAPEEHE